MPGPGTAPSSLGRMEDFSPANCRGPPASESAAYPATGKRTPTAASLPRRARWLVQREDLCAHRRTVASATDPDLALFSCHAL
jgi:hypothetical protein